jgi:hypothetical protein
MRKRFLQAITLAVLALVLVCPQLALARIVRIGSGTAVTCGTTPTLLDDASVPDSIDRFISARLASGSGVIYIGHHTAAKPLTVANGTPLYDKERFESGERVQAGLQYYCIASTPTPARVWEQG